MVQPFDRSRWPSAYPPNETGEPGPEGRSNAGDTQVATQMLRTEDDYLDDRPDIGRAVGGNVRELFVSVDPSEALRQQLDYHHPTFVALHDMACSTSKKLLAGVAAAYGKPVQHLQIRRQGYGTTLATIDYVDCPTTRRNESLRLYSTDAEADSALRHSLSKILLSYSTLGVVMVGELPPHALSEQMQRMREHMFEGGWVCRNLQFMPLFPLPWLAGQAADLGMGTGAQVRVTPQVHRPAEAWTYLTAAWNQLQGLMYPDGSGLQLGPFTTDQGATPMPKTGKAGGGSSGGSLERMMQGLAELPGVVSCCIFEVATSRALAQLGMEPAPVELARRGTTLLAATNSARKQLGMAGHADEVIVMGGAHALAIRTLSTRPELAVHIAFTPAKADWPALRPRVMALDAALEPRAAI